MYYIITAASLYSPHLVSTNVDLMLALHQHCTQLAIVTVQINRLYHVYACEICTIKYQLNLPIISVQ